MEMRSSGSTGGSHLPDDLPGFHQLTLLDQDFGQMEIHRIETQPMVQEHALPRENMIDSEPHHTVIRRGDGGAKRSPDVFPIVRIPRLTIHDSHATENPGSLAAYRLHETRLPEFALGIGRERLLHLLLLCLPTR